MRWALLLLLCWPLLAQSPVVEIGDSRIRARDLAAVFGEPSRPDLDLGPAPAPRVRRRVTAAQLERWAQRAGAAPEALPRQVVLLRKMRPWLEDEAAALLRRLLAESYRGEIDLSLIGFAEREIPAGPLEWRLLASPRSLGGETRINVGWRDRGGRSGVESVSVALTIRTPALIAVRDLRAGESVAASDFRSGVIEAAGMNPDYLEELQADARWTLKRSLKAGEALLSRAIERRPEVTRGAMVELLVVVGAVRLRAPARAEGAGSAGDLVAFRNLETNRRVIARIRDAKTAEVRR